MPSSSCDEAAAGICAAARDSCLEIFRTLEVHVVGFDAQTSLLFEIPAPRFYFSRNLVPDPREPSLLPSLPPCELCRPPYVLFPPERFLVDVGYMCANFGYALRNYLPQRMFD